MAMSMPVRLPLSSSKCQGGLVLPVPTMSLPRSSAVRSTLPDAACAAPFCGSSNVPAASMAPAAPRPSKLRRCVKLSMFPSPFRTARPQPGAGKPQMTIKRPYSEEPGLSQSGPGPPRRPHGNVRKSHVREPIARRPRPVTRITAILRTKWSDIDAGGRFRSFMEAVHGKPQRSYCRFEARAEEVRRQAGSERHAEIRRRRTDYRAPEGGRGAADRESRPISSRVDRTRRPPSVRTQSSSHWSARRAAWFPET